MSYSLLAHLYPHIRGSQEDIATLSLQYLLSQSNELNKSFTALIADTLQAEFTSALQYSCQEPLDFRRRYATRIIRHAV